MKTARFSKTSKVWKIDSFFRLLTMFACTSKAIIVVIDPDLLFEENTQSFIANLEVLPKLLPRLSLDEKVFILEYK